MKNRRDLLATIAGAGLVLDAGCLGNAQPRDSGDDDDGNGEEESRGDDGDEEKPEISHEVSLVAVEDDPTAAPFEFEITFLSNTLSSSEMPRFELTIRNVGDEEQILDVGGRNYVVPGRSDPDGLRTLTEREADQIITYFVEGDGLPEGVGGIAANPTGCLSDVHVARDADYETHPFEGGEERVDEYAIAGSDMDDQTCPDEGTYDLYTRVTNGATDQVSDWEAFEWGFTVELR